VFLAGLLWELEGIKVQKTPVSTILFKPLVKKKHTVPKQKTVFYAHAAFAKKNSVNSGVMMMQAHCKHQRVSSEKMLPNTSFLDVFKLFERELIAGAQHSAGARHAQAASRPGGIQFVCYPTTLNQPKPGGFRLTWRTHCRAFTLRIHSRDCGNICWECPKITVVF